MSDIDKRCSASEDEAALQARMAREDAIDGAVEECRAKAYTYILADTIKRMQEDPEFAAEVLREYESHGGLDFDGYSSDAMASMLVSLAKGDAAAAQEAALKHATKCAESWARDLADNEANLKLRQLGGLS